MYIIYRIYYGEEIVYIGRTTQKLQTRLYGHFHKTPNLRTININLVTKIEFATLETQSDLFVYEIYYINKYKPILNSDDKSKDKLTIELPELEFKEFFSYLLEKWKHEIELKDIEHNIKTKEEKQMIEFRRNQKKLMRETLSNEKYLEWLDNC